MDVANVFVSINAKDFERRIVTRVRPKHKLLEKPRGVCEMPFCGTHIFHRLDHLIFDAQWRC
jgi:hypothetical protein